MKIDLSIDVIDAVGIAAIEANVENRHYRGRYDMTGRHLVVLDHHGGEAAFKVDNIFDATSMLIRYASSHCYG